MMKTNFLLDGRYQLGERIGKGGMAEVCRARDTRLDQDVAVKRLKPDHADDPILRERFQREVRAIAGNRHPSIITIFDSGEYEDEANQVTIPYIVMELLEGETLRNLLDREGKFPLPRAIEVTDAILSALAYTHDRGIIHRDIKPANVMITTFGQVKVLDFGIARINDTVTLTAAVAVPGTPAYLAPERVTGGQADARSDIYSTGCLFYELLTGLPPFVGPDAAGVVHQHTQALLTPPSQRETTIPTALDEICLKALAKDPAERYQTATDMRTALASAAGIPSKEDLSTTTPNLLLAPPTPTSAPEVLPQPQDNLIGELDSTLPPRQLGANHLKPLPTTPTLETEPPEKDRRRRGLLLLVICLLLLGLTGTTIGLVTNAYLKHSTGELNPTYADLPTTNPPTGDPTETENLPTSPATSGATSTTTTPTTLTPSTNSGPTTTTT
ncbi:MAG: protein kinase, partial [Propionibacteriaceae bacterium]|nr:protein kinase [Propionibacteriaceae bacterium]